MALICCILVSHSQPLIYQVALIYVSLYIINCKTGFASGCYLSIQNRSLYLNGNRAAPCVSQRWHMPDACCRLPQTPTSMIPLAWLDRSHLEITWMTIQCHPIVCVFDTSFWQALLKGRNNQRAHDLNWRLLRSLEGQHFLFHNFYCTGFDYGALKGMWEDAA